MPIEKLRARSRVLMWLVTVPMVLIALTILIEIASLWRAGPYAGQILILHLPMYIYFWAIVMIRQALSAMASGALFEAVVPRLLVRVGLALFVGAILNVFGYPLLMALFYHKVGFVAWDGAAVTLGIVGATLALLAQLLAGAAEMRAELDEMF